MWSDVAAVPASTLSVALLLIFCQWSCQGLRLWALIPAAVPLTLGRAVYAFGVGSWFNAVAPARAGDAIKVVLLNRTNHQRLASVPQATGLILADKLVDVGTLLVLCAAAGFPNLFGEGASVKLASTAVTLAGGGVMVLLLVGLRLAPRGWPRRLGRLQAGLATGLSALIDPVRVFTSSFLSLGAWTAELLAIRVLCSAFGSPPTLPQIMLGLAILNVGTSVPVSIANVGIYEAALAFGLHRARVPLPSAVLIATLHHALELLVTSLGAAGARLGVEVGAIA